MSQYLILSKPFHFSQAHSSVFRLMSTVFWFLGAVLRHARRFCSFEESCFQTKHLEGTLAPLMQGTILKNQKPLSFVERLMRMSRLVKLVFLLFFVLFFIDEIVVTETPKKWIWFYSLELVSAIHGAWSVSLKAVACCGRDGKSHENIFLFYSASAKFCLNVCRRSISRLAVNVGNGANDENDLF